MEQDFDQKVNSQKEASRASFFKTETLTTIDERAFLNSSTAKTEGKFTVVTTPHQTFGINCEGNIFTVLKMEGEPEHLSNLGSACDFCNIRLSLPFALTKEKVGTLEERAEFEYAFQARLEQILRLLRGEDFDRQ